MLKTIKYFLARLTGANDHFFGVDAYQNCSTRVDFEQALRLSESSGCSLAREINGEYCDITTQSAWWCWQLVSSKPYNPSIEAYTIEQHRQEFQSTFIKNVLASTVNIEELYSTNDRMEYNIGWVNSAWIMWMQATRMYQIQ